MRQLPSGFAALSQQNVCQDNISRTQIIAALSESLVTSDRLRPSYVTWKSAPNFCCKITRNLVVYRAQIHSSNVADLIQVCMSIWKKEIILKCLVTAR